MSAISKIQWTDRTWNPVRGCSIVSPGCVNCYAMKQAHRFGGPGKAYEGLTKQTSAGPQWTGRIRELTGALEEPFSWRKPTRVFVNSMSDLFHEGVDFNFIAAVWRAMAQNQRHTFQILTKRPARMLEFTQWMAGEDHISIAEWPRNVWLGVSAEDQQRADERIPLLLQTPAAVRFVSAEPLLGQIDFVTGGEVTEVGHINWLRGLKGSDSAIPALDWIIVGGESGPRARVGDGAWIRSIVSQCQSAHVPVFVKQMGTRPHLRDRKGGDPSEWPEDLRVREFPAAS